MAIKQPAIPANYTLQTEVASRMILLSRDVVDNGSGAVLTTFGCDIIPRSTTYELDAEGKEVGVYDSADLDRITVPQNQMMELFGIRVTLADGTVSYVGEVLSNFADQIIAGNGCGSGTITTQEINIPAILAAQAAADLLAEQAAIAAQDAASRAANGQ